VEGWLHQTALPEPEITVTAYQSITGKRSQTRICARLFGIIGMVIRKDVLNAIRMKKRHAFKWTHPDPDNVSLVPLKVK